MKNFLTALVISVSLFACTKTQKETQKTGTPTGSSSNATENPSKSKLQLLSENFESEKDPSKKFTMLQEILKMLSDADASKKEKDQLGPKNFQDLLGNIKTLAEQFLKENPKGGEQKPAQVAAGAMFTWEELNDVIGKIIERVKEIFVVNKEQEQEHIIGSPDCGTMKVTNDDLEPGGATCQKVKEIAECVRNKCNAPFKIIMCSEKPDMPICNLNSKPLCDVEPGVCAKDENDIPRVQKEVEDAHNNNNGNGLGGGGGKNEPI